VTSLDIGEGVRTGREVVHAIFPQKAEGKAGKVVPLRARKSKSKPPPLKRNTNLSRLRRHPRLNHNPSLSPNI